MKKARLFNDCTGKWIEFDWEKVEEIDNKPLTEKDLKAIEEFKRRIKEVIMVSVLIFLAGMFVGSIVACSTYDNMMISAYCSTHRRLTNDYLQCKQKPLYKLVREVDE